VTASQIPSGELRKRIWWAALEVAGIDRVVTIEDLRHTCASLMHTADRSAKEVKGQLGHSTIAMTLDTHIHLSIRAGTRESSVSS
jgi:integrase